MSAQLFLTSSFLISPPTPTSSHFPKFSCNFQPINLKHGQSYALSLTPKPRKKSFTTRADDGDVESGSADDYDMEEEVEEVDNKKDYDVEYDRLLVASLMPSASAEVGDDIEMVQSKSFVSTQGWDPEMVVDYRIDEEEFHKISLMDCDFFIRKPPDPDNGVYDFREMYVTPPDTDVYSIPKVLAPMPQKYIRCSKSDYGCYNVTEPPIDAPRDPLYKSSKDILKVFLTKHYRNRRINDPEFVLDFEEIYVIDSKTKSITRGKVLVTIPEGRNRDRRKDLLIIRDKGNSFKIIPISERDDPTTVIEREEWVQTRMDMEKHLRKLRDFNVSNWF
ncbi:PLASTID TRANSCRIPTIONALLY ACTIVE protein 6, chloroplastic [Aristolochia californica]|uniref:PLASTID TRANSCRIPTIONALLY ACTIVE protein 6, chloroplastic n=1 Tax=Aristolochia californica TaxID=171875 RepID=UPI0035DFA716